jgi:hypothetical protein
VKALASSRAFLAASARTSGVYDLLEPWHSKVLIGRWRASGRAIPAPSAVKREILRGYARRYGLDTLVETGTYKADTVRALRRDFDRIYSIEVDPGLHRRAERRCRRQRNAVLLCGDSADLLPEVLDRLGGPALFWLDAHCSGAGTGSGATETPILRELSSILGRPGSAHVVLVDDHREFARGQVDYPDEEHLHDLVAGTGYDIEVADDILRLLPSTVAEAR